MYVFFSAEACDPLEITDPTSDEPGASGFINDDDFVSHRNVDTHGRLTREEDATKKWMKMGSSAHEALKKIATQKQLVADMEKMNEKVYTTYLD